MNQMGKKYSLINRVVSRIKSRRQNMIEGKVNCIPSPFERFKEDFIGIEQGQYYLISASTKGGKSQLTNFLFVYTPLLYAFDNPDKVRVKIFYFPFEETDEDLLLRFMCFMLYKKHHVIVSKKQLLSTGEALPEDILRIIESEEYTMYMRWFEDHVEISKKKDVDKIVKHLKDYALANGKVKYKDVEDFDADLEVESYEANDPGEYRIVVCDHLSLINETKGKNLKQTIDDMSKACVDLRNDFKFTFAQVQQQDFAMDRSSDKTVSKGEPTRAGLGDSKYPGRDCNMMFGIYAPYHFKVPEYNRYDIMKLKDRVRFFSVLANREGSVGGMIGLRFIGECAYFEELPRPDDARIEEYYQQIDIQGKKIKLMHHIWTNLKNKFINEDDLDKEILKQIREQRKLYEELLKTNEANYKPSVCVRGYKFFMQIFKMFGL